MDEETETCPCCGDHLGPRQLNQHLARLLLSVTQELGGIDPHDDGGEPKTGDGARAGAKLESSDIISNISSNNSNEIGGNRDEFEGK
jgi:hypothetical protein